MARAWRLGRLALLAWVLGALAGCAALLPASPRPEYGAGAPPGRPARVALAQVPFFPQDDDLCGPAVLATLLQSAGVPRLPEQLVDQVYLPERKGSLQVEMLGASRRAGTVAHVLRPLPDALLQEVAAGHPVAVLQDVGTLRTQWHYAVVVGYDLAERTITLRSGTVRALVMDISAFDRSWARSGRWAFVALPPDRLPATAAEPDYLASVLALERVVPGAGEQALRTALERWPASLLARLALGNAAYRAGRLQEARAQYQHATEDHPGAGDAWNNLAQVLHEQGLGTQAAQAARRAVAIGGPRRPQYEATLAGIESAWPTPGSAGKSP